MATTSTLLGKAVGNDRFDDEAAGWDNNPFVHKATDAAYDALKQCVPALVRDEKNIDVLEIGCGTGLLSFRVAAHARIVVAVDASPGMIRVLQTKLSQSGAPQNIKPVCVLLEDPEDSHLPPADDGDDDNSRGPRMKFDLITSHLVLHHIDELEPVLKTMLGCLKPGGQVALTDFEDFRPDAKKFHPKSKLEGVARHGIARAWIEDLLKKTGFVDVDVKVGWTMKKAVENFEGEFGNRGVGDEGQGSLMDFPFLVCVGTKP